LARFITEAGAKMVRGRAGTNGENMIYVSVTGFSGEPITDLTEQNFQIYTIDVARGGSAVEIKNFGSTGKSDNSPHGFYWMTIVPAENRKWVRGFYTFGLTVERGEDKGQTLVQLNVF
jgi:hypothetical protein